MNQRSDEAPMQTRWLLNPNMVLREEGGQGAILYDPDSGAVHLLNLTAASICRLLDGQRTVVDVIEALKAQFDGMDAEAEAQVRDSLQSLQRLGAVGIVQELQP
jgi:PqqD family protein of HPr-rel-A system